jgi:excisionase family DNA binding protein
VNEPLRTAAELAEYFGVKAGTVLDWYESGRIPAEAVVRLGGTPRGQLRFRVAVIEEAWNPAPRKLEVAGP